jgi:hypothetical protein
LKRTTKTNTPAASIARPTAKEFQGSSVVGTKK